MGCKKQVWLIALTMVMLPWIAEGKQAPEWTQNVDPSRYLLTAAEMPQQQAIPGEIKISEPTYASDFAEKDYRNPSGKLNWWYTIRQDFTNTTDAGKQAQVTIMVFENALHAGYSWRLTNRPTGEDTRSAIDDFYKNAGAGVPPSVAVGTWRGTSG